MKVVRNTESTQWKKRKKRTALGLARRWPDTGRRKKKNNESVKMKKLEKQAENADYIMGVEVWATGNELPLKHFRNQLVRSGMHFRITALGKLLRRWQKEGISIGKLLKIFQQSEVKLTKIFSQENGDVDKNTVSYRRNWKCTVR